MLSQESGVRSQQLAAGNDNSDDDSDDDSGNINISDEQRGLSATMQGSSQSGSKRRNTIKELGLQQGSASRRYCGAGGQVTGCCLTFILYLLPPPSPPQIRLHMALFSV